MKNICYIIGASTVGNYKLHINSSDYVIAADAGYSHLKKLGITADLVVGDFDSLNPMPTHDNIICHQPEKDDTDMMLAVNEGLNRGFDDFVIYGGVGGRLDHTFGNLQILTYISMQNKNAFLVGENVVITSITNNSIKLKANKTGYISVFCFGSEATGVDISNLKYEVTNATFKNSIPLGVSNEFIGKDSEISVKDGTLIIMWYENDFNLSDL